ncbi:hypothetical protein ACFL5O_09620 [Myxococcota bacterium]
MTVAQKTETVANLVDHVLPPSVPLRQFVVTFPFELGARAEVIASRRC